MEMNIASLFIIAGMAIYIGVQNGTIRYLKQERNYYKKVAEKLEQDINQLTKNK